MGGDHPPCSIWDPSNRLKNYRKQSWDTGGAGGSSGAVYGMRSGEDKELESSTVWKSKHTLQLQRAWVVHSAWASIENVCKISSNILVNKLQCEHIADHFKVIGNVLKKMGLNKDFVIGQALEGGSSIQTNLTFDETHFNHIAKTFEKHVLSMKNLFRLSLLETQIQDVLNILEEYVRELDVLDGSNEESLSTKTKINEGLQDYSLRGINTKENVEARSRDCKQRSLDKFLRLLLGVLKQGEDLVLFHSRLEEATNGVVERTGLCGEKFVQIHELLYKLLDIYACLEHCEGTEFAKGCLSQPDSCKAQSLLYYLNSNCLGEYVSLSFDDICNSKPAIRLSELLERPNCVVKTLFIKGSFLELRKLQKCHLMVIGALSKCMSITNLTVHGLNREEVHELCKSLSINKVVENLVMLIDGPLVDDNAMDLSAMLKENQSLKSFTLKSRNISPKGATYFGAMLAENSSLEELNLQFPGSNKIGMKDLMRPLMVNIDEEPQVNFSLKHLHIDIIGEFHLEVAEIIAQLLHTNKILTHFSIQFENLDPDAICKILVSLKKNRTLQVLDLRGWSRFNNNLEVAACLEAMLIENSTLEELKVDMHVWDKLCLKHLLRPLMGNKDGEPHVNISLRRLHILNYNCYRHWEVAESIAQMLCTNETLVHFSMINASLQVFEASEILHSLRSNKSLLVLNLEECKGLDDPWVKVVFMDLLVNYNFTLSTIKMHGRDWDIEAFIKFELDNPIMANTRFWRLVGGTSESLRVPNADDLKQAFKDFQLTKGEGSALDVDGSFMMAYEEHQEELVEGYPAISGLKGKLEMESDQSLQELKPLLESAMKSTNFLLRRNLNMAQLLQERYSQWNSFVEMYPFELTCEEKDDFSKGCITAALFPKTFLYHLKACLLQGPNFGGILHMLKEVAGLVVQRMKNLQDSRSQTFQFIDYVDFQAPLDVQHIYSPREKIAIFETFSTKIGIGEELQEENSIKYGIVQDHLTGAYYFENEKSLHLDEPNIDKPIGVIGVKVTSTKIQVEIMWDDGSYYSGELEDFSYDLELNDNKQCALEAFGDFKGAHFLGTCGLKCSPFLVIALAMATHKKGLSLTWSNGKGHIESNSIQSFVQPMEQEVWECQILCGGDINQLGEAVKWGMNQFDQHSTSSSRENQCQVILEEDPERNNPVPNIFNDTSKNMCSHRCDDNSSDTHNSEDLTVAVAKFVAGVQNKQALSIGCKVLGSGGDVSFEIRNSKGKKVKDQAYEKIQELYWKEKGGYKIGKLNARHDLLEENLCQGSLYAKHDLNYLVVYDDHTASHVSIYWAHENNDESRLELEWITDIQVKEGPERIKSIFKGLKGETLEVRRRCTKFYENPLQQQSRGLVKSFLNHLSNKSSCKDIALQMVPLLEGHSNDEWEHIVGPQPVTCSNKFWWKASYMQAITCSRTRYSSGLLLSTHATKEDGLKKGSASRKSRHDGVDYVHYLDDVKSCAKFSKPPQSLSKWHQMIHWGGLKETLD